MAHIDARRIYATGFSNGAMMCFRLAAEMSDRIAAIGTVAGTMARGLPAPSRPVPLIHFHGTLDPAFPFREGEAGETLELRPAEGSERFTPLSDPDKTEHPDPGEIIYVVSETKEIMCRRWNWRNGFRTRITEETEAMVMNIDGLGKDCEKRTLSIRDRVAQMLAHYCGAEVQTALLTPVEPCFSFER